MKIIIITLPNFFEGETGIVNRLFHLGMERLHLRKPAASVEELSAWIGQISPEFRNRIVLHDHHELLLRYSLGGVHLNSRNPEVPSWLNNDVTISRSCHSLEEVREFKDKFDYLFLSPIYNSISKEGYNSAFTKAELVEAQSQGLLADNVFALGGISFDKISELSSLGFSGVAILGDLWKCLL